MEGSRARRGPYKRGVQRRLQVVSAAIDVFGQYGFKAGTLQRVAERVGVSPGAIEKLFGSKEQLLVAVLEHWGELTTDVIGRDKRGTAQLEGFRTLMAYHVRHKALLELYTTMAAEATSPEHPAHDFMTERYRGTLHTMRQLFVDAVHDGDFRPMSEAEILSEAECLLAIMDGLEVQFLLDPERDLVRSFGLYVDRLLARLSQVPPLS
jgi:AcrR family transcriptional regulator